MSDTQHLAPPSSQTLQQVHCLSIKRLVSLEPNDSPQTTTQRIMLLIRFHSAGAPPLVEDGSDQWVADNPISIYPVASGILSAQLLFFILPPSC